MAPCMYTHTPPYSFMHVHIPCTQSQVYTSMSHVYWTHSPSHMHTYQMHTPYTTRHAYIEILLSISSLNKSKRCPQGTELVFWNNFHMPPIFKVIKREEPSYNKIKKLKCLEIKTFQNVHKTFMGKIINHIERLRSGDTHHGYEQKDWH